MYCRAPVADIGHMAIVLVNFGLIWSWSGGDAQGLPFLVGTVK